MSKKKRHTSQPRFHRMKRAARLSNAQAWLPKYDGKNVVRGYRKRYGVDLLCAIAELQMLSARLGMRLSMSNSATRRILADVTKLGRDVACIGHEAADEAPSIVFVNR